MFAMLSMSNGQYPLQWAVTIVGCGNLYVNLLEEMGLVVELMLFEDYCLGYMPFWAREH